jgi:hypothetical protein
MTSHRNRYLVELQGYCGLTDREVCEVDPWLRLAPALCATWTFVATLAGSTTALVVLAAIAALGAALPWHPFDLPYALVLHRSLGTARIPRSPMPRRFACTVATAWLAATAVAMGSGASRGQRCWDSCSQWSRWCRW